MAQWITVTQKRHANLKSRIYTQLTQLNTALEQYCDKYELLDTSCEKYQSVLSDPDTQRVRVQAYNDKIEQFVVDAAKFYNNQVS